VPIHAGRRSLPEEWTTRGGRLAVSIPSILGGSNSLSACAAKPEAKSDPARDPIVELGLVNPLGDTRDVSGTGSNCRLFQPMLLYEMSGVVRRPMAILEVT